MNNRYREEELAENNDSEMKIEDKEINEKELEDEEIKDEKSLEENSSSEKPNKKIKKLEGKIHKLNEQVAELEEKLKKSNDQYLRLLADTENYKKRIDDERIRDRKYASQRLLEKLVTNIDIFDKACNMKTEDQNLKNFLIGFQMINNNLKTILEEEGVKKIKCDGKFDPHYHHAVEFGYDEKKEEGEIIMVIKDGYMYKDRILVASLVKVNKKPEEKTENKDSDKKSEDQDK